MMTGSLLLNTRFVSLCACLPFLFAGAASAAEPASFSRTLAVSGPVSIEVKSDPGGVSVVSGSSGSVVVHATVKPILGMLDLGVSEANIAALVKNPPIEQSGGTIRIGYPKDTSLLRGVTVHYDIETPRETTVRAYTESGGIRIAGVRGPAETTTQSGRTEVSDVAAGLKIMGRSGAVTVRNAGENVSVRVESGGVQLQGAAGSVDVETTSGRIELGTVGGQARAVTRSASIRIDGVKGNVLARDSSGSIEALGVGGAIDAETSSGAIRLGQTSAAVIRAVSGSGSIKVELARGAGYQLSAESKSGKISGKAVKGMARDKNAHSLAGAIAGGGPSVRLETRSSKIEVE